MPEPQYFRDDRTGARVEQLVTGECRNEVVYPTHWMWTPNQEYLVLQSDRGSGGEFMEPYALCMKTFQTRRLVAGRVDACALGRKHGRLYYLAGRDLYVVNVGMMFRNVAGPRKVASLPGSIKQAVGGITLDASEDTLYAGTALDEGTHWGIISLDLTSKGWRLVTETSFMVGHLQANPDISGVLMFCHETGGDSPQRTWLVNGNGTGLRPFYKETYNEWVTHEVWWGALRAVFTIWPYDEVHRRKPHGIVSADMATGTPAVHAQFPAWHVHGSPDGKWVVADDKEGNLWLVNALSGERRLLTQGHNALNSGVHLHPSFTPDSKGVVFNSARNNAQDILLARLPEWESLPKA